MRIWEINISADPGKIDYSYYIELIANDFSINGELSHLENSIQILTDANESDMNAFVSKIKQSIISPYISYIEIGDKEEPNGFNSFKTTNQQFTYTPSVEALGFSFSKIFKRNKR